MNPYVDYFGNLHMGSPLGSDPSLEDSADTSGAQAASPDRDLDAGSDSMRAATALPAAASDPFLTPFTGSEAAISLAPRFGGGFRR